MKQFFAIIAVAASVAAHAQQVELIQSPPLGAEATVAAGEEIFSAGRIYSVEGITLEADTKAGSWLLEQPVAKGTKLVPVSSKAKLKACAPQPNTLTPSGPCFLDDDGDGTFDRQSADEIEMARKLKPPVPYSKGKVSVWREDTFKRVILYQGATSDTLRFSYREFNFDMARPAFTEELSIPRETFPSMIMVKKVQLEVLGVTGMGLRYRVVKAN